MQIDWAVEAKVRDGIGHCLHGNRDEVERILADLTQNGQLLEALKMWAAVSVSTMGTVNPDDTTVGDLMTYAHNMVELQNCGYLIPEDEPILVELLEDIWNGNVTIQQPELGRYTRYILEAATHFMGSFAPEGMDENHPDPDAVAPWWEELDLVWQDYAAASEGTIRVSLVEVVS